MFFDDILRSRVAPLLAALFIGCSAIAAHAQTPRTSAQVLADYQAALNDEPRFNRNDQYSVRAGRFMLANLAPSLKHQLELLDELDKVDPARAQAAAEARCIILVRLSIWGDGDATKSLQDAANSTLPAQALIGKAGLAMCQWWTQPEDAAKKKFVDDYEALAKANPKSDLLLSAALTMARYHPASDDNAAALRDIAEHVLTGPAATRYKARPDKIGRPFKVTVRTLDGKTLNTANWKGKVVLIDFWATWCPPCVAAVPALTQRFHDNQAKGLEILGVSDDLDIKALKEFLASHSDMTWPQSFNPANGYQGHVLARQLNIPGIPTTYFIDRNGILRDIQTGHFDEKVLQQLLDEPAKPQSAPDATAAVDASASPAAAAPADNAATTSTTPTTPTSAAATADEATEKQADAMLSLANSYISIKRPDRAAEKLTQLIAKYPNTKAAAKAKELLPQLTTK